MIDEHLARLTIRVAHIKVENMAYTVKDEGVIVQHDVLLSCISRNRRVRSLRFSRFTFKTSLSQWQQLCHWQGQFLARAGAHAFRCPDGVPDNLDVDFTNSVNGVEILIYHLQEMG